MDREGRYIVLNLLLHNNPVALVNYDTPNQEAEKLKIPDNSAHIFDQPDVAKDTTYISGDFNMIFDIDLDTDGGFPKLHTKLASKLLSVRGNFVTKVKQINSKSDLI